ncbi:hypothetical protein ANRL3_00085 [Anaerolineae bacterium]|nr:hypothetical protein ANRL3_00085 [Anaerolineae bacterium]
MNGYNLANQKDWIRNATLLVVLVFAVTLAIVVGNRLSDQALAVLVGALCGISATLPVSVALLIAMNRNWGRAESRREEYEPRQPAAQPPVIFIAPPQAAPWQSGFYQDQHFFPPSAPTPGAPRDFKIVGDE